MPVHPADGQVIEAPHAAKHAEQAFEPGRVTRSDQPEDILQLGHPPGLGVPTQERDTFLQGVFKFPASFFGAAQAPQDTKAGGRWHHLGVLSPFRF